MKTSSAYTFYSIKYHYEIKEQKKSSRKSIRDNPHLSLRHKTTA